MVLEHVFLVLEILSAVWILYYLNNQAFRFNLKNITVMSVDVIWISAINEYHLSHSLTMLIYVLLFIYSGVEFGFQPRKMVINMILAVLIMSTLQIVAMLGATLLFRNNELSDWAYLVINVLVFILVIFILKKVRLYRISYMLQQQDWVSFLAVVVAGIFLFFYIISYKSKHMLNAKEYVPIYVLILYCCLLMAAWKHYKNAALEKAIEIKTVKLYSDAYENMIEDIRAKQHDFDNHLNAIISQHYTCKDYDSLVERQREYMELAKSNNRYNKLLTAGDSMLAGFLYGKCMDADQKGVSVDCHIRCRKYQGVAPMYQVISLLGNLFDNAVEAVLQEAHQEIVVKVEDRDGKTVLEVNNPSSCISRNDIAQFFKRRYSKKGENRGYGLYNVKRICEQYGIMLSCELDEKNEQKWMKIKMLINNI